MLPNCETTLCASLTPIRDHLWDGRCAKVRSGYIFTPIVSVNAASATAFEGQRELNSLFPV